MVKQIISILFLVLLPGSLLACDCNSRPLLDYFAESGFVAKIRITKIVPDPQNEDYYVADITTITLYKGQPQKQIRISGRGSMCNINAKENTDWVVFAIKDKQAQLILNYCSGNIELNRKYDAARYPGIDQKIAETICLKLTVLDFLAKEKITINKKQNDLTGHYKVLKSIRGFAVKEKQFALYKIRFGKDSLVSQVKAIKEFNSTKKISADIVRALQKATLSRGFIQKLKQQKNKIEDKELIIGLYAYPPEMGYPSFISINDL
jgi:hypothetical protein